MSTNLAVKPPPPTLLVGLPGGFLYAGVRDEDGTRVYVDAGLAERLLPPAFVGSSYEWGSDVLPSDCWDLAQALLAHHFGDAGYALSYFTAFSLDVVARLDYEGWTLTSQEIDDAIRHILARQRRAAA